MKLSHEIRETNKRLEEISLSTPIVYRMRTVNTHSREIIKEWHEQNKTPDNMKEHIQGINNNLGNPTDILDRQNNMKSREERINEIDKMFDVDPRNSMTPS